MDAPLTYTPTRQALLAYVGPFALFCLLLALPGLVKPAHPDAATPLWLAAPEFWVYPLQTVLCGAMLLFYRREYPRAASAAGLGLGALAGLVVFGLWVSPQAFFHFAPRWDGFDPTRLLHMYDRHHAVSFTPRPDEVSWHRPTGEITTAHLLYQATVAFTLPAAWS